MTEPTATLPESWQEVPFGLYCQYAASTTLSELVTALAHIVALPPEQLLGNMRAYSAIRQDLAWMDTLPPAPEQAPAVILHQMVRYELVGHLDTINAGQLEALLATLAEHEQAPVLAGPAILALLYKPRHVEQTVAVIREATEAFQTLKMSKAWPALQSFMLASGPIALSFQQYSAARSVVSNLLTDLEATLPGSTGSRGFSSKLLSGGARRWIRSARKTLGPS